MSVIIFDRLSTGSILILLGGSCFTWFSLCAWQEGSWLQDSLVNHSDH